jgi:hypothetical protein
MASSTGNEGTSYSPTISSNSRTDEQEELLPWPDQVSMQKFKLYKTQSVLFLLCIFFCDLFNLHSQIHCRIRLFWIAYK